MYKSPKNWTGRMDGLTEEYLRWHQKIVLSNFPEIQMEDESFYGILGFNVDEGVRRNKGRVGAKNGPDTIRKMCANFPAVKSNLYDLGDIYCRNQKLEDAQGKLADLVKEIQVKNGKSIVFGGGHEVMYGHFSGLKRAYPKAKIGIINFDAHFDNREIDPNIGPSSGTGFWQIAQEKAHYRYLAIGIQQNANTKVLFDFAKKENTQYILGENFMPNNGIELKINEFIESVDILYLTVCLDVFAAAVAPGVSAPAFSGIYPDNFFRNIFKLIAYNPKLKAFDIAELNPSLDVDNRTARLAASLVFDLVNV